MKSYVTPMLSFESFDLTSNTATSCGLKTDTQSSGSCGLDIGGQVIFLTSVAGCITKVEDGKKYCYHALADAAKIFNS